MAHQRLEWIAPRHLYLALASARLCRGAACRFLPAWLRGRLGCLRRGLRRSLCPRRGCSLCTQAEPAGCQHYSDYQCYRSTHGSLIPAHGFFTGGVGPFPPPAPRAASAGFVKNVVTVNTPATVSPGRIGYLVPFTCWAFGSANSRSPTLMIRDNR